MPPSSLSALLISKNTVMKLSPIWRISDCARSNMCFTKQQREDDRFDESLSAAAGAGVVGDDATEDGINITNGTRNQETEMRQQQQ